MPRFASFFQLRNKLPPETKGIIKKAIALKKANSKRHYESMKLRQKRVVYKPTKKDRVYPRGHPHLATRVVPGNPKEDFFVFNAVPRSKDRCGKYPARYMRDKLEMVPATIITNESSDNMRNWVQAKPCSVPKQEVKRLEREGRMFNRVFSIKMEGEEKPILAILSHYHSRNVGSEDPYNMIFIRYRPNERTYKVKIPIEFDNYLDSQTLRKGGMLRPMVGLYGVDCYWKGGTDIPEGISMDLLHTRVNFVYHLERFMLPEGLTIARDRWRPTLATIQGKLRRGEDVEEVDAPDVAAKTPAKTPAKK